MHDILHHIISVCMIHYLNLVCMIHYLQYRCMSCTTYYLIHYTAFAANNLTIEFNCV